VRYLTTTHPDDVLARRRRGRSRLRQSGITLVELIIVMVLVGILVAIGVPSFQSVTTSSRMSAESNDLLGDMQYARAEAAREGQAITVCISSNGTTCDTASTTWQEGWIVFSDLKSDQQVDTGDAVLRIQKALSGTDTFTSPTPDYAVTFTREGFAQLGGATPPLIITLQNTSAGSYYTRCLVIAQAGMMSIQTTGCT
jgi:type IV fimbrial biogenesis protein FimT